MTIIKEIMAKKVVWFLPEDSVLKASKEMAKRNISCVVIVNNKKEKIPIGIVTERDINKKIVAKNHKPSEKQLEDIMTSPVLTINEDVDFLHATELMKQKKIRRLPVVRNGKLVGIITQTDLLRTATQFINSVSDQITDVLQKL